MPISPSIFRQLNLEVLEDIKQEWRLQGHKAFGNLENSARADELFIGNTIVLEATALPYAEELEKGVSASDINLSSSDFQKLTEWVKLRGIGKGKFSDKQIAYFILKKWKSEGKPLETSRAYSQTGDILHAVEIALTEWREKYVAILNSLIENELDNTFRSQIKSGTV